VDTPASFLALVGKILPKQIDAQVNTDFRNMSDEQLKAYIVEEARALGTLGIQTESPSG